MSKNSMLNKAKANKKDEFYTQYKDIEKEVVYYRDHFKDKIIYCNCDNPEWSNFWKYFKDDFNILGIKKLISTFINFNGSSIKTELELIDGNLIETKTPLIGNGDFRSDECIEILKECDIVVTNPPFSLFKEFLPLLVKYNKDFLIIGEQNAITYKEIFPLIKNKKVWLGITMDGSNRYFEIPSHYNLDKGGKEENGKKYAFPKGCRWFTSLDYPKRHEKAVLKKSIEESCQMFDNLMVLNVDRFDNTPYDFPCVIAVPISALDKISPDQFDIIGTNDIKDSVPNFLDTNNDKGYLKKYNLIHYYNGKSTEVKINYYTLIKVSKEEALTKSSFYKEKNEEIYYLKPFSRLYIQRNDVDWILSNDDFQNKIYNCFYNTEYENLFYADCINQVLVFKFKFINSKTINFKLMELQLEDGNRINTIINEDFEKNDVGLDKLKNKIYDYYRIESYFKKD